VALSLTESGRALLLSCHKTQSKAKQQSDQLTKNGVKRILSSPILERSLSNKVISLNSSTGSSSTTYSSDNTESSEHSGKNFYSSNGNSNVSNSSAFAPFGAESETNEAICTWAHKNPLAGSSPPRNEEISAKKTHDYRKQHNLPKVDSLDSLADWCSSQPIGYSVQIQATTPYITQDASTVFTQREAMSWKSVRILESSCGNMAYLSDSSSSSSSSSRDSFSDDSENEEGISDEQLV
jgi:hypothetical protein